MEILKLDNNYYLKILKDNSNIKSISVENLNFFNFLNSKNIVLLVDFKNIKYKKYKKIIKKLLFLKKIKADKFGIITNKNEKMLGYLRNYDKTDQFQRDFILGLNAIFYKTRKERYNYIYDTVCSYLDSFFYGKNLCDFHNNQCGKEGQPHI